MAKGLYPGAHVKIGPDLKLQGASKNLISSRTSAHIYLVGVMPCMYAYRPRISNIVVLCHNSLISYVRHSPIWWAFAQDSIMVQVICTVALFLAFFRW